MVENFGALDPSFFKKDDNDDDDGRFHCFIVVVIVRADMNDDSNR